MTASRALRYFLREAAADLWKRRTVNVVSIATIGASLYIVGLFVLLTTNAERLIASWAEESRISVYLSDTIADAARAGLERKVAEHPAVKNREYVSKQAALERFRTSFPDLADLAVGLDDNPLPASIEITVRKDEADGATIEALAGSLAKEPGVEGVRYDLAWVRRVRALLRVLGIGGAVLGAILIAAAIITIYGVIRLNVFARRDEIEILRLVGATRGFIRGPFLVEGAFQGMAASLVALGLIAATWAFLAANRQVRGDLLLVALVGRFLPPWAPPALLALGLAVGLIGSLFSVRRAIGASRPALARAVRS